MTENRPKPGQDVPLMPGQLPPTPGVSEGETESGGEYVLVDRQRRSTDLSVKDGDMSPPPPPTRNEE